MALLPSLTQTTPAQTARSFTYDGAELKYVPKEQVSACFHEFIPFFRLILKREKHLSLNYIHDNLQEGHAQLWVLTRDTPIGVMVTQIERFEDRNIGLLWMVAGKGIQAGFEAYRRVIEPWFIGNDCRMIEIRGRKGWAKVLPDYDDVGVILRKHV